MRILLTGATGYIGKRLLPVLLEQGHQVICCVRDKDRFHFSHPDIEIFETDFAYPADLSSAPLDFDAAYYLIHSMNSGIDNFSEAEEKTARNFVSLLDASKARQIIYLSGLSPEGKLSAHLSSRNKVAEILKLSSVPLTVLKAGIIVGSGSASFEIIRDLTEKLPVMVTPIWLKTKHQPISIRNVIQYLTLVLRDERTYNSAYEIGGADVLSYKDMLLTYAELRGLKRKIFILPVLTPKLSSYWLYFVTSVSFPLAANLVNSMRHELIVNDHRLEKLYNLKLFTYREAVELAFQRISRNMVISSWKDSFVSSLSIPSINNYLSVPEHGVLKDFRRMAINGDTDKVLDNIWSIGGEKGWYYGNILWGFRGFIDKLIGGVGINRGRANRKELMPGDSLDYWRVLVADKDNKRLLLYAEMKLPGEAWLEFKIKNDNGKNYLEQKAVFRPRGLAGRMYWYLLLPAHHFIFGGMIKNIVNEPEAVIT